MEVSHIHLRIRAGFDPALPKIIHGLRPSNMSMDMWVYKGFFSMKDNPHTSTHLVPPAGFEPAHSGLKGQCATSYATEANSANAGSRTLTPCGTAF